jgi:hypothetical protein
MLLKIVEKMLRGAGRISTASASFVSGLGAFLTIATFVFGLYFPGRLCGAQYVTTMTAGTVMLLVGPLILARVRVDEMKFAAAVVVEKKKVDLGWDRAGRN